MTGTGGMLMMVTSALCTLLNVAVEVALLVAILIVVGKHRKDAVFAMRVASTLIFVSATACLLVGIVKLAKGESLQPPGAMPS